MRCLLLAALALLILPACDSGGDAGSDALLGTWNTQSGTATTYLTVSQSQNLLDPFQPGTGGLVVSGAVSGTLRYAARSSTVGGLGVLVGNAPLFSATVALSVAGDRVELLAQQPNGGGGARTFVYAGFEAPYVLTPTSFRIASARFVEAGTGAEVTVAGTLTFLLIPLTGGQESTASSSTFTRAEAGRLDVTFGASGAFSQTNQDLTTSAGTWADVGGGQVRIRVGQGEPNTFGYAVRGSSLTLSFDEALVPADVEEQLVAFYGLLPGTLTSARREGVETFARGAGAAQPPAGPAAARPAGPVAAFPFRRP